MNKKIHNFFFAHEGNNHTPHFFKEATIATLMAIALALFVSSIGSSYVIQSTNMVSTIYKAVLVDLTNEARASSNRPALAVSPTLENAATLKAQDMASKSYFAHTSPEGITPWYWFKKAGYVFSYAGENLAVGFQKTEDVNKGWLNSPTHKANILSTQFTEIGIGTADGVYKGKKTTYVVQMFGKPKKAAPKPVRVTEAPTTNTQASAITTAVAGESIAQAETLRVTELYSDENLAIVENDDKAEAPSAAPVEQTAGTEELSVQERMLVNQPFLVQYILAAIALLTTLALFIYLAHEVKVRHTKHVVYGCLLLALTIGMFLVNKSFILIDHIV